MATPGQGVAAEHEIFPLRVNNMKEEKQTSIYEIVLLIGVAAVFVWLLSAFGIEPALVFATVISGLIWGAYLLFRGKRKPEAGKEKAKEPLMVDYARSFFPIFLFVLLCLLYTSPSPRDDTTSRMPSSA